MLKKLFGGIDLNWKKLLLFAVIVGVYTGIMAWIPFDLNTSFRDIAVNFEWWILFGTIIIANSKSPKDSALKCFVFFLISYLLFYLIRIPSDTMGFGLLYWLEMFALILSTALIGYVGYYIKKKNVWSFLILIPVLIMLASLGLFYLRSVVNSFPQHLLSSVFCFFAIVIIVLGIFDKREWKILSLAVVGMFVAVDLTFFTGLKTYEVDVDLREYGVNLSEDYYTPLYGGDQGEVKIVKNEDDNYVMKLMGHRNGNYSFSVKSEHEDTVYYFRYSFDMMGRLTISRVDYVEYAD